MMNQDEKGHVRRTSEPLETNSSIPQDQIGNRRQLFERHNSTNNLRNVNTSLWTSQAPLSNVSIPDITTLSAHWVTNSPTQVDFLGASISQINSSAARLGPEVSFSRGNSDQSSPGLSSTLHDAARITNWDEVLAHCKVHPEYARYSGRDGWTALHHACNRRCPRPEVAEALIRAYPDALLKEEDKGWLPLHYACRFKAPKDVVRLLLHMFPDKGRAAVSKRDRLGRTPLFYAIRYDAPSGVVGLLLEVDPSVVLEEDQNEDSLLALVWDSWAEKSEGKRSLQNFLTSPDAASPDDHSPEARAVVLRELLQKDTKLLKRWQKVNMLLKAAFGFPVDEEALENNEVEPEEKVCGRKWRIVHATTAVKCHISLFLLACALHPEQIREVDECDLRRQGHHEKGPRKHQTALHLASSSNVGGENGKTIILALLKRYREAAEIPDGYDGSLPFHRIVENERKQDWPMHAAILYHCYPQAVRVPDKNGKLPLHRAASAIMHVEREHNTGVQRSVIIQLVRAYPQAASHADANGCLPLHHIALHAEVWDDDVEAIFSAYPRAATVRAGQSFDSRAPLHMAAANPDSRESLLARLVEVNPRAASLTDRHGKLPLHLACELGKEWDTGVGAIYNAFHAAMGKREDNERGWMPLHMVAACSGASTDLLVTVLGTNPSAASMIDSEGRYPLHLACRSGKCWLGGLQQLFEIEPAAISAPDSSGFVPLLLAALRYCKPDADPKPESPRKSAKPSDPSESMKLDILYNLLRADPTVLPFD